MQFLKRTRLAALLVALLAALLGWFLLQFAFGSGLVNLSYDLLHLSRFRHLPAPEAVVVYLDERSHRELDRPLNKPWDRALHAALLDRLTDAGARAVVLDVVFSDANPDSLQADEKLIAAVKRNGRVVAGADSILTGARQREFIPPFPALRAALADFGSVEVAPSRDLIVRSHAPNEQLSSVSWAAAKLVGAPVTRRSEAGQFQPATEEGIRAWANYYGPPLHLRHVSFAEALDPARVPATFFSNKVVFVGARIMTKLQNERNDEYGNPFSFWITRKDAVPFIAGVEIQATLFLNILRGDWLRRLPTAAELWMLIVLGAVAGFGLMRLRPIPAILSALLALALVAVISRGVFLTQLVWFPWLIAVVQITFALLCSVAVNSVRLYVENRLFVQSLELYLSPKLVRKFARDKDRALLKPGADKQVLTILFSDIADFTKLSEGMDSDELALLMNVYFQGAVAGCIHATDGTVVKYIGDAIFAFWNAPEPQSDHAARACAAALRFREQGKEIVNGRTLVTRIGLHTGVANVGNFGSATRVDYTAIGESINLASRMEGLNKHLGTQVLITGDTRRAIGDGFVTRRLGRFRLKGFEKSVTVHELLASRGDGDPYASLCNTFESAVNLYQSGELHDAELDFHRVLAAFPEDGPSRFYLRELELLRDQPTPEGWDGVVELHEK